MGGNGLRTRTALVCLVAVLTLCSGCGARVTRDEYSQQQTAADEFTLEVLAALKSDLSGSTPTDGTWGFGHSTICKFHSDEVGYIVDATLSFPPAGTRQTLRRSVTALQKLGVDSHYDSAADAARGSKGRLNVDLVPTRMGTTTNELAVSVSVDCQKVGQEAASDIATQKARRIR